MAIRYTDEELSAAEDYLRDRLRNERSMSADVERLLEAYAAYLLSALFSDASDEEVEALLDDLVRMLMEDCETLAVDEHDRRDGILAYILGERGGDTLEGRVRKRVNTFFNECFAVFMAGKLLGKKYDVLVPSMKEYFKHPWDNEVIKEAREKQEKGEIPPDYDFSEPHYGRGNPVSSLTALELMLGYAVADAWQWWGYEDAKERGARGYFVLRGSSYPCDICDSHTGVFYYITDESNRPQYHQNCCCLVVYSYADRYA